MAPVVDRLTKEYEGSVEVRKVNVEASADTAALAAQYRVQYVPTFVFIDSTGAVADTIVGETTEADLKAALDSLR